GRGEEAESNEARPADRIHAPTRRTGFASRLRSRGPPRRDARGWESPRGAARVRLAWTEHPESSCGVGRLLLSAADRWEGHDPEHGPSQITFRSFRLRRGASPKILSR